MDIKEMMAAKTSARVDTPIQLDGAAAQRIDSLREEIREAHKADLRENRNALAPGLRDELREMVEQAKGTQVIFTFESIGRLAWDAMVVAHPARAEDKKIEKEAAWNLDTFPPALIAASCVEPEMTLEEATEIWEDPDWSGNELTRLFSTAWMVNQETPSIPFDRLGIELMQIIEPKSDGVLNEESPEASI